MVWEGAKVCWHMVRWRVSFGRSTTLEWSGENGLEEHDLLKKKESNQQSHAPTMTDWAFRAGHFPFSLRKIGPPYGVGWYALGELLSHHLRRTRWREKTAWLGGRALLGCPHVGRRHGFFNLLQSSCFSASPSGFDEK